MIPKTDPYKFNIIINKNSKKQSNEGRSSNQSSLNFPVYFSQVYLFLYISLIA